MSLKIGAIPGDQEISSERQSPTAHMGSFPMDACDFANGGGGKTKLTISRPAKPKQCGGDVIDAVLVISPL